jgi:hypothetical protein
MDEPQRWGRSRYFALLGVSVLHVAVLAALVIAVKTRFLTTPPSAPIELLILPQYAAPIVPPLPTPSDRHKKVAANLAPPPDALTNITPNSASDVAGPSIDWSEEAHNEVANLAKDAPTLNDTIAAPPSQSPFAAPPAHHKGEQIPTGDGRWIVYVSDNCYQVSKSITAITNATNTGVGTQTYCNQKSRLPRGDLFKQLPAYKKYHPDN